MSAKAEMGCRCGEVRGIVTDPSPKSVNRVVCYCDDCQAFAHHLGRADLLDVHGGSDIVQVAPASLSFVRGQQRIAGVRLTPKGVFRWHSTCCNTPVGNSLKPAIPFVGIFAQVFSGGTQGADALFGKPIGAIMGEFAVGEVPSASKRFGPALLLRAIPMVLGWRLGGRAWPHPFFDRRTREPIYPLVTLTDAQRAALRPLCGPHPTAVISGTR
ncbi:MAG TPA: DUF6151 family protein [Stellaceae bacterium]|nr:DUF6151 family protein [Stellaceae bacterium]